MFLLSFLFCRCFDCLMKWNPPDIEMAEGQQRISEMQTTIERLILALEAAKLGIWDWDISSNLIIWNTYQETLLGYAPGTAEGTYEDWACRVHPADLPWVEAAIQTAREEHQQFSAEYRVLLPQGEIRWIESTGQFHYDASGQAVRMVGLLRDVSDRKQAELSLQERARELSQVNRILARTAAVLKTRNQELDQFAYVASHDLKAPLRAIANLSEWIEEDLSGQLHPENQHQMVLLRGRVHRMEALIDGLLQYSRVGRNEAIAEPACLTDLLNEILDTIELPPGFTVTVPPELPTLTARKILLRQVFSNLITNAIKHHNRSNGQVRIGVTDSGDEYEFTVADNGPGIAPTYHDKIFVIFQTLEARDTRESTGIGLAIVKKIVESEGGTIQVESEEGQGATFRFTWPKQPVSE